MDLAARYRAQFARPAAHHVLVRTEQYQRQLGETNPNATRIQVPPHTTGLAYDVYYHYMSGPEQDALMEMVAQDERAGLVESLRENRDPHPHLRVRGRPAATGDPGRGSAGGRAPPADGSGCGQERRIDGRAAARAGRSKISSGRAATARKAAPVRRAGQRTRQH
jgi:hypothetical protein